MKSAHNIAYVFWMNGLKTTMKAPRDYSADDLAQFIKLVQDGGEVAIGLINRIQTAKSLVMISHQDLVCAVAALKIPNMRYRQRVFAKSGMTKCGDLYTYELGWIFVTPEFRGRGLSTKLVRAGLTCAEGKSLFATTRSDNEPMQRVLKKSGFKKCGMPYPSIQNPGSKIQVYTAGYSS